MRVFKDSIGHEHSGPGKNFGVLELKNSEMALKVIELS
jgi:hypothetical protein